MKYRCLDCQNVVRVGRCASWRAAQPKCMACGSPRLERYTSTARPINPDSEAVWNEPSDVQEGISIPAHLGVDEC